ncbi:MAG TPA: heavy-metal-associated domain-containing protein [Burkholderiaceae bacterium]|nr:heavy-metal-associated domain-containing protein [Burkholderiaceae bacterium]
MSSFHLPDMSCGHCVAAITEALKAADPEVRLDFQREARTVQVQSRLDDARLAELLSEAGYPPAAG